MSARSEALHIEVEPGIFLGVDDSGPRDGMPIVFSNSLAADIGMWDEVVRELPGDFRCIRYDARGHGRSHACVDGWTLPRLSRDLLAILDALSLPRAAICGLSLGGLAGMWLARHAPDRVHSLVLANTAANFPPPAMWQQRAAAVRESGMAPLVAPTTQRWFTPQFRDAAPDRVAQIAAMIAATPPHGYAGCCQVLADSDVTPDLPDIACPTLVIAGEFDASTPPARARELTAAIPDCAYVELNAAHMSSVEAAKDFAAALAKHVQGTNNTNN